MKFKLDERLQTDSVFVAKLGISQVRLSKDARYPWLILIPEIAGMSELDDLSWEQQLDVLASSNKLNKVLRELFQPYKLNTACLGNIVKQLHIHHIARFEYDESWPSPIWGQGKAVSYVDTELNARVAAIAQALS